MAMIPFVRDMSFDYGVADQVSPRIRRVVARNPGPFTFLGTGTYIIGRGETAVIDPGPLDEAHLQALLRELKDETVSVILLTHGHADHAPLARPLSEATGAPIVAAVAPTLAQTGPAVEEALADTHPDQVLKGGERFQGPGWTLRALPTPGHTHDHTAFVLEEENALFSGDHVMGWSTTVVAPPNGDMTDYLQSLRAVAEHGFDVLWPTHGPPITQPAPFLDAYLAHRLERERQILIGLAAGAERISDLVPTLYDGVDRRLWPAASLSVHAHLIDLERRGRVRADPAPSLDARYFVSA